MNLWQRKKVSTGDLVGVPAALPLHLVGLDEATLANLPAAFGQETLAQLELEDAGFTPVTVPDGRVDRLSPYDFLNRFTVEERVAIRQATLSNPVVEDFLELLKAVPAVELDIEATVQGLAYLTAQGLLAAGRADAIRGV